MFLKYDCILNITHEYFAVYQILLYFQIDYELANIFLIISVGLVPPLFIYFDYLTLTLLDLQSAEQNPFDWYRQGKNPKLLALLLVLSLFVKNYKHNPICIP